MRANSLNKLMIKSRANYDFFGSDNKENIHWGKIFIHLFGCCFSTYTSYQCSDVRKLVNELKSTYQVLKNNILSSNTASAENLFKVEYECSEVFIILKQGLCITVSENIIFLQYNTDISTKEIYKVLQIVKKYEIILQPVKKFYMVQFNGDFSLLEFNVAPCSINIKTHYNDDFFSIDNVITSALKTPKTNGIILLHGKYGTGKTYYLRHLINTVGRKFIYFPVNMIEALSSPSFLPFIAEHQNSVLIIEDCESLLIKRDNTLVNSAAIANLLNLGDGLLADALNINIICTFNTNISKIDEALLRKGRLIASYEFKDLETSKAQSLANNIGYNGLISKPMSVSEIYNSKSLNFEAKKTNTIGFR